MQKNECLVGRNMRDERTINAEILFLPFEPHLPWGYPITRR